MPTVDIHTHYVPEQLVAEARRGDALDGLRVERVDGQEWLIHRQGYRYPLVPAFYDLESRLASMDRLAVDVSVVSIAPTLFCYWLDAAAAVDFARRTNESLAEFVRGSGGRIRGVATLPMQDPAAAAAELRRAVGALALRGAEIGPAVEGLPLSDPRNRPVLEAAAELDVPLILHPYYVGSRPGLEDFYLTNLVGNPLETTVCAARLILGGILDDLPGLRVVLMHGGGFLPYQIGRLDHGHRVRPEARGCRQPPSAYLHRFWFDTVTHAAQPLRFLVDLVGADQVVFGTDFPFDMAAGPLAEQLRGVGLSPAGTVRIAGGNASQLFGLEQAGADR